MCFPQRAAGCCSPKCRPPALSPWPPQAAQLPGTKRKSLPQPSSTSCSSQKGEEPQAEGLTPMPPWCPERCPLPLLCGPGEVTGAGAVRDSTGAAWHVPCCALSPCTPGWSRASSRKAFFGVLPLGAHLPKVPGQSDLGEMGSLQGLRCKLQAPAVSPRLQGLLLCGG